MALVGYVNERPILGGRVNRMNDRKWVLMAPLDPGHPYLTERVGERRLEFE